LSFSECLELIDEYGDQLDWFLPKYEMVIEKNKIIDQLNLADAMLHSRLAVSVKENQAIYYKWRRDKKTRIDELTESLKKQETETVFERLKKQKSRKTETVFERLKRIK
jgi:ABC-type sugar transport system ATPase subunit